MNAILFLAGVRMASFLASSVFFLKFWKASRDRFFLLFSAACCLLAIECVVLSFLVHSNYSAMLSITEANGAVYLMRVCAFIMILLAIIEKNRKNKP